MAAPILYTNCRMAAPASNNSKLPVQLITE